MPLRAVFFDIGETLVDETRMWGAWAGREEAFYVASAALADELAWSDVLALGGSELRAVVAIARGARALAADDATALPERLAVGPFQILALGGAGVRVQSYSFLDPLDLCVGVGFLLPLGIVAGLIGGLVARDRADPARFRDYSSASGTVAMRLRPTTGAEPFRRALGIPDMSAPVGAN